MSNHAENNKHEKHNKRDKASKDTNDEQDDHDDQDDDETENLSLIKLKNFLELHNFIPIAYFFMDGSCFYIHILMSNTGDEIFLYIPSKYEFTLQEEKGKKLSQEDSKSLKEIESQSYNMVYLEMNPDESITNEYAGEPDEQSLLETYGEMINLSSNKEKIEEYLENNYKRAIPVNMIMKEDRSIIKSIYRQTRRLKYCVQDIPHKIGIMYKDSLCSIRRDNSLNCFLFKNYNNKNCKKLFVISDLESFYEKIEKIPDETKLVKDSLLKVLTKNQGSHVSLLDTLIKSKNDIISIPIKAEEKRKNYEILLNDARKTMEKIVETEKHTLSEIDALLNRKATEIGLHHDINIAYQEKQLQDKMSDMLSKKTKMNTLIIDLQDKLSNSVLNIDDMMFDNNVMFDTIVKNFARLKDYC